MAYTKTTWLDRAVQYAQRYFMNTDGGNDKNLLPPFSDWTLHANAVATLPYTLTLTATAVGQISTVTINVIASTAYFLSVTVGGSGNFKINWLDSSNALISATSYSTSTISATSPSTAVYAQIVTQSTASGTITFTNPQLELGSSATSFTPKKMYTIIQSGGTVTQAGTAVNAANLNNIEQGVYDAHQLAINTQILLHMGAI